MVVPSIDDGEPDGHGSRWDNRWDSMRTLHPLAWQRRTWLAFALTSLSSVLLTFFMMLFILIRRRLRMQMLNQFVVGLAFSDFTFSLLCLITCFLHYLHGHWFGGEWMCELQGVYVVYGFAASIWMNVLIARELYRMASCPLELKTYHPLPAREVLVRVAAVHTAALLFGCMTVIPFLPTDVGNFGGLACLPMEYDLASTVWHWGITLNAMLAAPLMVLVNYFVRVYYLVFQHPDSLGKDCSTVYFFTVLLVAFVAMWIGSGMLIWVDRASPLMDTLAGVLSHLQGTVSAIIYSCKTDIQEELQKVFSNVFSKLCCKRREQEERPSGAKLCRMMSFDTDGSLSSEAVQEMRDKLTKEMKEKILKLEKAVMNVVEFKTWQGMGHFPRSSEQVTRRYQESDKVIFISHRWWDSDRPDNADNTKYKTICQGLWSVVAKHNLKASEVVVWVDWACIEQDDHNAMQQGIASLITYVARADYVLIPVAPDPMALAHMDQANHSSSLHNYGERAWCRLEIYTYSCVAEVSRKLPHIYCFSPLTPGLLRCMQLRCWRFTQLLGFGKGVLKKLEATFDGSELPSEGEVTFEDDRHRIRLVEEEMRLIYVRNAVLKEQLRLMVKGSYCTARLAERQIESRHVPLVAGALTQPALAPRLRGLILDGNLLTAAGVAELMQEVVTNMKTPVLHYLSLSNNPRIGSEGVRCMSKSLLDPFCTLEQLVMSSCALDGTATCFLAEALRRSCCRLTKLDLPQNRIDEEAANELFEAAGGCEEPRVALDLEGNAISPALFVRLSRAGRLMELGLLQKNAPRRSIIRIAGDSDEQLGEEKIDNLEWEFTDDGDSKDSSFSGFEGEFGERHSFGERLSFGERQSFNQHNFGQRPSFFSMDESIYDDDDVFTL